MKIAIVLCMTVALVGCSTIQTAEAQKKKPRPEDTGKVYPYDATMDSPIIISDGSTHIHFNTFTVENKSDAHLLIPGTVNTLACIGKGITYSNGTSCTTISLSPGWTMDLYSTDGSGKKKVATLLDDGSGNVRIKLNKNSIDPEPESTFKAKHPDYVDVGFVLPFSGATLSNGGSTEFTCSTSCEMDLYKK